MKLIKNNSKSYTLQDEITHEKKLGSPEEIFLAMVNIGIPEEEIDFAILNMTKLNHTTAVFGELKKTFIYSE